MIDVVDRFGNPTGKVVDREKAHRVGFRHRAIHVWLVRKSRARRGRFEVLLQRRSHSSVCFPGCHDASCAGHIPAGNEWIPSALRKLKRELGVEAQPRDLFFVGKETISSHGYFYGRRFVNREVRVVYFLWCDRDEDAFSRYLDKGSSVRWMEMGDLRKRLGTRSFPDCISETEVDRLLRHPAIFPVSRGLHVRFSMKFGPKSLFDRVRYVIPLNEITSDPSAFHLIAAETQRDTGKLVRTHWNVFFDGGWYRHSQDCHGHVRYKELPDGKIHFCRAVREGFDYEFAERVNRALMDTTMDCEDRHVCVRRAKGLMN